MEKYVQEAINIAVQTRIPVLLWGGPGTGKTSFVNQLANKLGYHIETIIASIREPSDFSGLPVVERDGVRFEPPAWAKRLGNIDGDGALLFIDEISTTPPAVQAALLRVIHEGVVGDLRLPSMVSKVAAANPPDQAAGGWVLAPPLANRFIHIDWNTNHERWADGALRGWSDNLNPKRLPDNWRDGIAGAMSLVSAYIRHRPAALYAKPTDESASGRAWPSPRTWEMVSVVLAAIDSIVADDDVRFTLIAGAVGTGAAQEFINWMTNLDLPDPEWVISNPRKFKVPERSDQVYALLSSVVTVALNNLTKERWMAVWHILATVAKEKRPDIAAFAARTLIQQVDLKSDLPIPKKEIEVFAPILKEVYVL